MDNTKFAHKFGVGLRLKTYFQDCQPLHFGHNDYSFGALITPLHLSNPELC